jgi:hypothetical protein
MTTNSDSTGPCPFCREPVKLGARKCPHCHQWQGHRALAHHPAVQVALMMLPVLAFFFFTRQRFATHESFSGYRDQIAVVQSAMHYQSTDDKCGPTISVIGKIKNNSDVPWKDVYLEAQYFDAGGTMIDANGAEQYGLALPPHEEVAFRLRGVADRAERDYATHKVFVRSARDARSIF